MNARDADNGDLFLLLRLGVPSLNRALRFIDLVLSPPGCSRTYGGRSASSGERDEEGWFVRNRRRLFLIDKKYHGGLSSADEAELASLQADTSRYLDAVAPLPLAALEQLEALAEQATGADQLAPT